MPKNNIPPVSVSLFSKMARRFQALRKSAADHFACFLPSPPGKLSGFFWERLFSGVSMDAGQADPLKSLPKNAVIVYVVKHKSKFDFLFSQTRYRALGLPVPRLAFDMGIWIWQPVSRAFRIVLALLDEWIRHRRLLNPYQTHYYDRALFETGCAMLFLVEKKGFYRRFVKAGDDPLTFLIQFQKHTDRPVFLVTQLLFFTRYPAQSTNRLIDVMFGSSEHPGSIKKF
ncbi:hypothetical protein LJC41_07380, partial [Desulfosarcina sp. OttesenSCG-928-G17]|nr:hypothetical protein [Desulfosarcina sp. OttesenSCG-928-G17]